MKFKIIYFSSFFFFISLSLIANVNKKAVAACVGIDVNNHVALTGFRQSSTQENNVDFNTSSNCFGNVTSSTNTSLGVGRGPINQERDSKHNLGGLDENNYGLSGPNIFIPVNNQVDIYVPAYDPEFIQGIKH